MVTLYPPSDCTELSKTASSPPSSNEPYQPAATVSRQHQICSGVMVAKEVATQIYTYTHIPKRVH